LDQEEKRKLFFFGVVGLILSVLETFVILLLALVATATFSIVNQSSTTLTAKFSFLNLSPVELVQFGAITWFILTIVKLVANLFLTNCFNRYLATLLSNKQAVLHEKLIRACYSRIKFGKSIENLAAIDSGVEAILFGKIGAIFTIFNESVTFLMVIIGLVLADSPEVVIYLILLGIILLPTGRLLNGKARSEGILYAKYNAKLNRSILDSFGVYREILLSGEIGSFFQESIRLRERKNTSAAKLTTLGYLSRFVVETLVLILLFLIGIFSVLSGNLQGTIISLIMLFGAMSRLVPSIIRGQNALVLLNTSSGKAHFTQALLNSKEFNSQRESQVTTNLSFEPVIEFNDVSFAYSKAPEILHNLNIRIEKGEFVAIIGPSGVGKSTLIDLMLGFIKPKSGKITISNLEPEAAWRLWPSCISYVPQDPVMIEGNIVRNVCLRDTPDDADLVMSLMEDLNLVEELKDRFVDINQVNLGEKGLGLSGGQKQRVSIARAIYAKPKLIILDESTNSVDLKTEKQIIQVIERYRLESHATLIVIAHRPETIMAADKIILLNDGKLERVINPSEVHDFFLNLMK